MFSRLRLMPALLLVAAAPGMARNASPADEPGQSSESVQRIERIALGLELAEYARAVGDAEAMVVAAEIVGPLQVSDSEGDPDAAKAAPVDRDSLLDEAAELAEDDDDLLGRITAIRAAISKGCVGACDQPIALRRFVPESTKWTVEMRRPGGEPFIVAAQRDAKTAVDMKVYDETGTLVCEDLSHKIVIQCRVDPPWTSDFRIEIINHGPIGTGVKMLTN